MDFLIKQLLKWCLASTVPLSGRDRGQATPEYALVILAAVALAGTLIVWAKQSGAMGQLFSFVMSRVQEAAGQ